MSIIFRASPIIINAWHELTSNRAHGFVQLFYAEYFLIPLMRWMLLPCAYQQPKSADQFRIADWNFSPLRRELDYKLALKSQWECLASFWFITLTIMCHSIVYKFSSWFIISFLLCELSTKWVSWSSANQAWPKSCKLDRNEEQLQDRLRM